MTENTAGDTAEQTTVGAPTQSMIAHPLPPTAPDKLGTTRITGLPSSQEWVPAPIDPDPKQVERWEAFCAAQDQTSIPATDTTDAPSAADVAAGDAPALSATVGATPPLVDPDTAATSPAADPDPIVAVDPVSTPAVDADVTGDPEVAPDDGYHTP